MTHTKPDTPRSQNLVKVVLSFQKWPINFASNSEKNPQKTCFEHTMHQEQTSFWSNDQKCLKNHIDS